MGLEARAGAGAEVEDLLATAGALGMVLRLSEHVQRGQHQVLSLGDCEQLSKWRRTTNWASSHDHDHDDDGRTGLPSGSPRLEPFLGAQVSTESTIDRPTP